VQKPHPPIWVGGESRRALRRTAQLANGWYPIGSNPQFPMGEPAQLAAGIERLAAYASEAGRQAADIEIIYRTHDYALEKPAGTRRPFVGSADDVAADVRQYAAMGISQLIVDFVRLSRTPDEMLEHMEAMATQVWPQV
jgi:alkanesulfonate monooxygenase SsuD/methylene tetrahydromethanopterin reductase-like flavin-dependent oxidoreductase (luciferase family)